MHFVRSLLMVALVIPWVAASPRGNAFLRRDGEDDKDRDPGSSTVSLATGSSLSSTASPSTVPLEDQPSFVFSKDDSSFSNLLTGPTTPSKDRSSSNLNSISATTRTIPVGLTIASPPPASPTTFSYGTGFSSKADSTVDVLTTQVVYTTLTTCPVTNTITSGTQATEEITTTISTVTLTSTSTICTRCIAPPNTKAELSSVTSDVTLSFSALTQPTSGILQSSKPEIPHSGMVASPSKRFIGFSFPSKVSLTVSATSGSFISLPGYGIVPSPTSSPGDKAPLSNATGSITPVFTPSLLGNAYGGGFVRTPSVYATKLRFPNGPLEGVPPGYGISTGQQASADTRNETSIRTTIRVATVTKGLSSPTATLRGPMSVGGAANLFNVSIISSTATSPQTVVSSVEPSIPANTTGNPALASSPASVFPNGTMSGDATLAPVSNVKPLIGTGGNGISVSSVIVSNKSGNLTSPLVSHTATSGEIIVTTSTPTPIFVSSIITSGEVIVQTSSPPPALISLTGSNSEGEASTPRPVLVTSTAADGNVTVSTSAGAPFVVSQTTPRSDITLVGASSLPPVVVISTASKDETFAGSSTPPGVLVSYTASGGEIILQTQTPTPANITPFSSVIGSPIVIGMVGSPRTLSGNAASVPIAIAAESQPVQRPGPGQAIITALTGSQPTAIAVMPFVGANGQTSFAVTPGSSPGQTLSASQQPSLISFPTIDANGQTSFVEVPAPPAGTQLLSSADATASITTAIIGSSGVTSIVAGAAPPVTGAPASTLTEIDAISPTPIVGANGLTSFATVTTPTPAVQASGSLQSATILTPVVGPNGLTSLAVVLPAELTEQIPASGAPATVLRPVVGANGLTSLAVIPSPTVGANGLTSLAVFSTPVAAALGLTSPAVILTPVIGANGLTSLAVLATPIVGANGLTSLAIGLQGDQVISGTPSPLQGFIPVTTALPGSENPPDGVVPTLLSGIPSGQGSIINQATGSGDNSSVHVILNPTAVVHFEGSGPGLKLSLGYGIGLAGSVVFLFLL